MQLVMKRPGIGSKRALVAAIVVTAAIISLFALSPLLRDASAALHHHAAAPTVVEWPKHELDLEWRGGREAPVQVDRMHRRRADQLPRGSFDRVLDLAKHQ